jgi:uroporphyrin-III C-methyltransferase
MADRGRVVLIGGGPGADDLITVRGLDRLLAADVVIHDRLAPLGLLERLGPDVEVIDASRMPGRPRLSYEQVAQLMVDHALAGRTVARLKGGDPFVLAHGAQEMRACTAAGVPVEVVPGISSATASAVFAGVPLTSTDGAAGFTVVSGHLHPGDPANRIDWSAIARSGTTVVILMGMRHLAAVADRLIAHGVPIDAPATVVADGSLPGQQVVSTRLDDLAAAVERAGVTHPATVMIGTVARAAAARILVLGGSRSGKSRHAEHLAAGGGPVAYVATALRDADDPEWAERIERHRRRRPQDWSTVETLALADVFAQNPDRTLLVDSITTWLAATMDACGCWTEPPAADADDRLAAAIDALVGSWAETRSRVVAVSDEVGSGIVPATRSGRRFRDLLGELNQRLAAGADQVWLVTAGIPQRLR